MAAKNSTTEHYATGNAAAYGLVDPGVYGDHGIYPTAAADGWAAPGDSTQPGVHARSSIAPGRASRPARDRTERRCLRAAQGVSKRFGEHLAVDEVTLEIARGEIFCLLGASGSGKTTLLRLLAGFETPSAGRLLLDGEDLAAVPPYRRPLNMMFQSYALFPHLSVERNVAFGLRAGARAEGRDRAGASGRFSKSSRMTPYRARKPHQLSGGQRQRVALARALVKRPKLLLLDEPLAALDRKLREHTQFELLNIQQQLGVTFIVVTHDQEEAMTLATRIGVMDHGRIVQVGTPRQIYEQPATRFVADFIGSVNLFDGRVAAQRAGRYARALPAAAGAGTPRARCR